MVVSCTMAMTLGVVLYSTLVSNIEENFFGSDGAGDA